MTTSGITQTWRQSLMDGLGQAINTLPESSETVTLRTELSHMQERVASNRALVAVFGAFSAGKSSLLNAMVDEPLLTVSPNPTTATVTEIEFAPENGSSGEVRITAKTHEQMWEDVRRAFASMHQTVANLEEAASVGASIDLARLNPNARRAGSFIKAFAAGYQVMGARLGTTWGAEAEELRRFTAEERFACFLQRVTLQRRATRDLPEGLVLVDTPGVDSIHRRHTDVAFEYMRRADAIVFVLYYTHAFSRADKDFLTQLAGVQDVTGQDKLFVVLNAVDLAKSPEELQDVRTRVMTELRQFGIRNPRLFEVSSQVAMASTRLGRDPQDETMRQLLRQRLRLTANDELAPWTLLLQQSGMPKFHDDLVGFLETESERFTKDSVQRVLQSVREELVDLRAGYLAALSASEAEQAAMQVKRLAYADTLRAELANVKTGGSPIETALTAEWDELIFHSGERIRLRFGALFREAFHPGRFRDNEKARDKLTEAADELAETLSRQVEMENRTFALRVGRQLDSSLVRWQAEHRNSLRDLGVTRSLNPHAESLPELPIAPEDRVDLPSSLFAAGFRHFKSVKQFIEEGGRDAMQAAVEVPALTAVNEALKHQAERVTEAAHETLKAVLTLHLSDLLKMLTESDGDSAINDQQLSIDELDKAIHWIDRYFESPVWGKMSAGVM